jgi:uncharacterized membrane protein (UPF0127 family)
MLVCRRKIILIAKNYGFLSSRQTQRSSRKIGQNNLMKNISVLLFFVATSLCQVSQAQIGPQLDLQRIKLTAGMHLIDAQVAASPAQRATGLMLRGDMPQTEGMLFVFEQPEVQCFWMKNTLLPLTAAFVANDGTIVNLADMQPQTTNPHCSTQAVRYVLEMNQGWFNKKGIKAGFKLSGMPFNLK